MAEIQPVLKEDGVIRIIVNSNDRVEFVENVADTNESLVLNECGIRIKSLERGVGDSIQVQQIYNEDFSSPPVETVKPSLKLSKEHTQNEPLLLYQNATVTDNGSFLLFDDNQVPNSSASDATTERSVTQQIPKCRRGRPRKNKCVTPQQDEIVHTCRKTIKTKSRTIIHRGECNCAIDQIPVDNVISSSNQTERLAMPENTPRANIKRKHMEGNFEEVKDYVYASSRIRDLYKSWHKSYDVVNGAEVIPEYKTQALERHRRQMEMRTSQRYSIFHTWESVLACKNRVEEQTKAKYTLHSKTRFFEDEKPKPAKRVLFELKRSKGHSVVVPYNGIPIMWIGNRVYACHLGRPRCKSKPKEVADPWMTVGRGSFMKPKKIVQSKKVGCPATFSVTKIARFPDFEVNDDSRGKNAVSAELRKAWQTQPERVRFYIEYYVKRPKLEDHVGHDFEDSKVNTKFQEPLDPKVEQKIQDLIYQGVTGTKLIREHVATFVKQELFKDSHPPPNRHRYNPCSQDIRNVMKKTRAKLNKAGKSMIGIECLALIRSVGEVVNKTTNTDYLAQLKDHLTHLHTLVKDGAPLDSLLACRAKIKEESKITEKSIKQKRAEADISAAATLVDEVAHYTYSLSETDHAAQVVYKEDLVQDEGVTQIYYYEQVPSSEEIYATQVIDTTSF